MGETGLEGDGRNVVNQILNEPQNADLLSYGITWAGTPQPNDGFNDGDPDSMIEEVLIRAQYLGATDSQLGRLDAIMNEVLTLNRGEANGIMYSQFDVTGPQNVLSSELGR